MFQQEQVRALIAVLHTVTDRYAGRPKDTEAIARSGRYALGSRSQNRQRLQPLVRQPTMDLSCERRLILPPPLVTFLDLIHSQHLMRLYTQHPLFLHLLLPES